MISYFDTLNELQKVVYSNDINALQAMIMSQTPRISEEILNERDCDGKSALHMAVENGDLKCVNMLLKLPGIKIDIEDYDDMTPLHYAAASSRFGGGGRVDIVVLLLLFGAQTDLIEYRYKLTPFDLAKKYGNQEVANVLDPENFEDVSLTSDSGKFKELLFSKCDVEYIDILQKLIA